MEIDLVHSIILKSSSDRSEDEKDKLKAFLSVIKVKTFRKL